ncbi:polysaccharide deacetylase family protein [Candidatus Parcubacteria bacterium]|jgi:peptidoglycan/xylan/chitin deacetylase (PgdA/CDA1 family)|nr:polysaccharide deacetylase family protein [Candidatus Parcubacteria bacterium]MBT3949255.1 polysaccharide deacetylase family protein [Candidatus Parcubacteria bacterium]
MRKVLSIFFFIFVFSGCSSVPVSNPEVKEEASVVENSAVEKKINLVELQDSFFIPILALHHVGNPPASLSDSAKTWYISEEKFENILRVIEDNDYTALSMTEFLDFLRQKKIPEKSIVLTFDDGAKDFYEVAFPLLQKYNVKATMHIMTGVRGDDWLSAEEIKEMHDTGLVDFESHTKYHAYLTRISRDEALVELQKSKEYLESILEKQVEVIAYPFGLYNEDVKDIAREAGYKVGLTIKGNIEQKSDDLLELHRIIITEYSNIEEILSIEEVDKMPKL